MGQGEVLLGTCWGTHWKPREMLRTHWKFDEDTMGTLWEHVENNKYPTPPNPPTKEKERCNNHVCKYMVTID